MTHYEDERGIKIGDTTAEAIAFLKANPSSDIYRYDDDGHETEVTRDIRDEIVAAEEAAKDETTILRETVRMLYNANVRLTERVAALEEWQRQHMTNNR